AVFEANTMAGIARATGGALPADGMVEPMTRAIAERGRTIPAAEYIGHLQLMQREARRLAAFFTRHDIWLSPVLATLPPKLGWFDTGTLDADAWARELLGFVPFAWLANVGGQPAMSVPLGQSR